MYFFPILHMRLSPFNLPCFFLLFSSHFVVKEERMRATCYFQSQLFQHTLSNYFCLLIKIPSSDSLATLESDSGSLTTSAWI